MPAPDSVLKLCETFADNREHYHSGNYNEAQPRKEFLDLRDLTEEKIKLARLRLRPQKPESRTRSERKRALECRRSR